MRSYINWPNKIRLSGEKIVVTLGLAGFLLEYSKAAVQSNICCVTLNPKIFNICIVKSTFWARICKTPNLISVKEQ